MAPDKEWDFTVLSYVQAEQIEIGPKTFAVFVVNAGAVGSPVATVNNFPINAPLAANTNGEAFSIGESNGATIKRKTLNLGFPNGTLNVRVVVVQAFYV